MSKNKSRVLDDDTGISEVEVVDNKEVDKAAVDEPANLKSIYKSKTFWVNVIALIGFIVQQKSGFVIDENIQIQILAIINILLRAVTKEPVVWK